MRLVRRRRVGACACGKGLAMAVAQRDQVRFSRPAHLHGLELVSACYHSRTFPTHVHEEYVIGAMTSGAETLAIRGGTHIAGRGDLILIEPGEAHSNRAFGSATFAYAVMYIPERLMKQALRDLTGIDEVSLPRFRAPTPHLAAFRRHLVRTHAMLSASPEALEQQSGFLMFLSRLLESQQFCFAPPAAGREHCKVSVARNYIDAHFRDNISLGEIAAVAGLSPFHLLRSFRSQVGLPPATYQIQLRITEAKRLLRTGQCIAGTAAELGFVDQSHLTRHFQRIVGTSPGKYIKQ